MAQYILLSLRQSVAVSIEYGVLICIGNGCRHALKSDRHFLVSLAASGCIFNRMAGKVFIPPSGRVSLIITDRSTA